MSEQKFDRLRERLTVAVPPPPPDLVAKLKEEIPDLRARTSSSRGASLSDHPALWRLAASVIMIFGFTYIAARMFLLSHKERTFTAEMSETPAAVARSASDSKLPDGVLAEAPAESTNFSDDQRIAMAPPAAAPQQQTYGYDAPPPPKAVLRRNDDAETSDKLAKSKPAAERELASRDEVRAKEESAEGFAVEVAAAAPPPAAAPQAAASNTSRSERAADTAAAGSLQVQGKSARKREYAEEKDSQQRIDCSEPVTRGSSGIVVVSIEIAADGRVSSAKILKGVDEAADAAVLSAVKKWTYASQSSATTKSVAINLAGGNCKP